MTKPQAINLEKLEKLPAPLAFDRREGILTPKPKRSLVEFAETELSLTDDKGRVSGPFTWDMTPFWIEPALVLGDATVDQVTVSKCTQAGGTTLGNNWLAWVVCENPGGFLDVMPTEDAIERRKKRLQGMFRANPILLEHLNGGNAKNLTVSGAELDNMNYYSGFAGSAVTLADLPVPYVRLDETGKFPENVGKEGNPVGQAQARQRWFYYRMLYVVSSPVLEGDVLDNEFVAGDRCEYHVPCPHCESYAMLTWDNVMLDKGEDGHLLEHTAYLDGSSSKHCRYVCGKCGAFWTERQRWEAIKRGVWLPDGMTKSKADARINIWKRFWDKKQKSRSARAKAIEVLYEQLRANHNAVHRSFHLSSLYLHPNITPLNRLASEFARATLLKRTGRIRYLQNFINLQLAEPWKETEKAMDELTLRRHVASADAPAHTVPPGVRALTAGIDVQKRGFYVAVFGWGFMYETYLLDAQWIPAGRVQGEGEESTVIPGTTEHLINYAVLVDALLTRSWVRAGNDEKIGIASAAIDSSDGNVTDVVYEFCNQFNDPLAVFPVKGDDGLSRELAYTDLNSQKFQRSRRSRQTFVQYRPGQMLWRFNPLMYKNRLWRWAANKEPGPGYLHLPPNVTDDFVKQFTAEELKPVRKGGKTRYIWKMKRGRTANHYLDCAVMATVAADRIGVRHIDDPAKKTTQPQQVRRRVGKMKMR